MARVPGAAELEQVAVVHQAEILGDVVLLAVEHTVAGGLRG